MHYYNEPCTVIGGYAIYTLSRVNSIPDNWSNEIRVAENSSNLRYPRLAIYRKELL